MYSVEQEKLMQNLYSSLHEPSKRRYAALEANKLGHGGKQYIKKLFGCSYDTLRKGLAALEREDLNQGKVQRKKGAGRKSKKTI